MRLRTGFVISEVGGKTVAVSVGTEPGAYHGMVTLNSTGKFIWLMVEGGASREEIYDALTDSYGIEKERARCDADAFLNKLRDAGVVAD